MAMIKCRECNKEISANAKICPKCGAKITYSFKDNIMNSLIFPTIIVIAYAIIAIILIIIKKS